MEHFSGLIFLFLAVCTGYLAASSRLVDRSATEILPQLLFNICYPAMILETFSSIDADLLLGSGLPVAAATVILTLVFLAGALLVFRRLPREKMALLTFLAGIGNITYVAIPLFQVFLPPEAVLVAILHSAAQDPLIWSVYNPLLLSSQSGEQPLLRRILTNPCLNATVLGLALVFSGLSLPAALQETLSRLSSITSPLALLLIGMLIHRYGLFSWLGDKQALAYGFVRVLLFPLVVGGVLLPFLPPANALLLAILFGAPAPLMAVAWATRSKSQVEFTIHCFLFSTLLYLLVMSPVLLFYSYFA